MRAEKFAADKSPESDLAHIAGALENIRRIQPEKLVLISTVDVIPPQTGDVFEDTDCGAMTDSLAPYGRNRLFLELEAQKLCPDALIIRLPGLFGENLKKNFIYDMINFIPAMLKKPKFDELRAAAPVLEDFYQEKKEEPGFFRLVPDIPGGDRVVLKAVFEKLGFSALDFTDSRSKFAFYNLKYLYGHIKILLGNNITLAHMAAEPVSAADLHQAIFGRGFINEIINKPFDYTFFKTRHAALLGGAEADKSNGYIFDNSRVTAEAAEFAKTKIIKLNN